MGQRLNIEIVEHGHELANCYYHWSAYTTSAIALTESILQKLDEAEEECGVGLAIELLEATGAGVNESERARINNDVALSRFSYKDCTDRNNGIISVTHEGMQETRDYEEGRVTVDIGTKTVCFNVMWYYPDATEVEDEYGHEGYNLWHTDFDFWNIPFEEFGELRTIVEHNPLGVETPDGLYRWVQ